MTIINHYVRLIPEARWTTKCAVCDDTCMAGEPIYWHGSGLNPKELGLNSHQGCYWEDSKQGGSAPYLNWGQVEALNMATAGGLKLQADPVERQQVQRLLGAVRKDVVARRRKLIGPRQADGAALRMGPDLLEGYRTVLKALGCHRDPFWHPVDANGTTRWTNPAKAAPVERPPMTAEEFSRRTEERIRASIESQRLKAAFRDKHLNRRVT